MAGTAMEPLTELQVYHRLAVAVVAIGLLGGLAILYL